MSEQSAAAAAALGIPEAIVQRSAAARAEETGMTVDEVLAAWAGGGDIPPPSSPAPAEAEAAEAEAEEPAAPADDSAEPAVTPSPTPTPVIETPAAAPVTAAPSLPGKPPVLVGEADNPIAILVGAVGLFVALFLVGVVGPALPTENPGARTSELPYSETALHGQEIYQSVGCASCHTQMVRPVVADVGLGAVSLSDTNQVLGSRRFGPDLSNVGARITASQIEAIITGLDDHPALSLSSEDLDALVAYLVESATLEETAPSEPTEEEPAEEAEHRRRDACHRGRGGRVVSDLSAAAEALGVPESIVQRSAAARAAETGMTVDEILAAWAGGGSVAGSPPAPADEEAPAEEPTAEPEAAAEPEEEAAPEAVPAEPVTSAPVPGALWPGDTLSGPGRGDRRRGGRASRGDHGPHRRDQGEDESRHPPLVGRGHVDHSRLRPLRSGRLRHR